ncbi:arginine N-succinyltransferase [Sphingomonas hengshuiensis]|uniref:Arginine N-succinyltransferase n=1 Tax=Sphingomonas hengshuiensis TaxID=1609977 RepID=A0A7U4JAW5_9SPHN|nr:arginine N-succinyltransferase [Sphingomonas hengshuiensis]AJP73456.1 arginine N-succinyltransferase [Sphingomonas hengshuiensis]
MLVVRQAGPADIDALMELAYLSGRGFTSLPEDRGVLSERLLLSQASFAGDVLPRQAWFVLMLENTETGQVDGLAAVKGGVGIQRPHFSFRVVTMEQYSSATETRFDHKALVLVNECGDCSEVGTLFLRPGKRQSGAGSLLARSRYLLIGTERDRFCDTVMAELRGWFDDADNSPFWDGIASKFYRLPFEDADRMITSTDGQFIRDLAPRHPIYLELVNADARDVIGAVHRHGVTAKRMLEKEGFRHSGLVDIFDGGPTMTAPRDSIRTLARARMLPWRVGDVEDAELALLSTTAIQGFRATRAPARIGADHVLVSSATLALLGFNDGALVQVSA